MSTSAYPIRNRQTLFINQDSGAEIVRQMRQDQMLMQTMGGLFVEQNDFSRVERVLDIYCGPGIWALEMAFQYQDMEVTGIDKSPSMVDFARMQAEVQGLDNVFFVEMDPAKELDFPDNAFDIVNARCIAPFFSKSDWPYAIKEFVRVTRPGGIIRLTEYDEPGISNSPALEHLKRLYIRSAALNYQSFASLSHGSNLSITPALRGFLQNVGSHTIQQKTHVLNFSAGTPVALAIYENFKIFYKLGQPFLIAMGLATQSELDRLYDQMLIEMLSEDFRGLWYFMTVWGYK